MGTYVNQRARVSETQKSLSFVFVYIALTTLISAYVARGHLSAPFEYDRNRVYSPCDCRDSINTTRSFISIMINPPEEFENRIYEGNQTKSDASVLEELNKLDPISILKTLAEGKTGDMAPEQFRHEIQELVSLLSPYNAEETHQPEPTAIDVINMFDKMIRNENATIDQLRQDPSILTSQLRDAKKRLEELKKKYLSSNAETIKRQLFTMFPQFLNLGQKTWANLTVDFNRERSHDPKVFLKSAPHFLRRPEFGGLIPFKQATYEVRMQIMMIHLYGLDTTQEEPSLAKNLILRMRMEKSLATDSERVRFLIDNQVITKERAITEQMSKLFDLLPFGFRNRAARNLLELVL